MPKLKSKRSIRRRFRVTKTGQFKHARANRRHLLSHRTTKRKRQLRRSVVSDAQARAIERLLPYA